MMIISRRNFLNLFFLIYISFSPAIYAAAWNIEKGKKQYISEFGYYKSNQFFNSNGDRESGNNLTKLSFNNYFVYGISKEWNIGIIQQIDKLSQDSNLLINGRKFIIPENANNISTKLFFQKELWRNEKNIISLQPIIKIPDITNINGKSEYDSSDVDIGIKVLFGHNFSDHLFLASDAEIKQKSINNSYFLTSSATIGRKFPKGILLYSQLNMHYKISDNESIINAFVAPVIVDKTENYDSVEAKIVAVKQINEQYLASISLYNNIYGRNSLAGTGVMVGIWKSW